MNKKYFAEFLGTFSLAFAVYVAVAAGPGLLPVPVLAALVVGVFVYAIGPISGCHLNPAVTIGVLSLQKISLKEAIIYIVSQFLGAGIAMAIGSSVLDMNVAAPAASLDLTVFLAELLGTFFLTFGIASVIFEKTPAALSGVLIAASLLLGVMMASMTGSAGILNPAVAFTLNSLSLVYILGPVFGSVLGMRAYRALI